MAFWRRLKDNTSFQVLDSGLLLRIIKIQAPSLAGRSLLFFTDTHLYGGRTRNIFGGTKLKRWNAAAEMKSMLIDAAKLLKPEYLVFGGDLVSASCMLPQAFEMLKEIPGGSSGRIAVQGNWDKRRRTWLPFRIYEDGFREAGFTLLINQWKDFSGLAVYGADDTKMGFPDIFDEPPEKAEFKCLLSHNPDGVADLQEDKAKIFNLTLCGHTHAGQIRLPLIGAVKTSSKYWKKYEYGLYGNPYQGKMYVSSGIGTTWLHIRINCPPEIVQIKFTL